MNCQGRERGGRRANPWFMVYKGQREKGHQKQEIYRKN